MTCAEAAREYALTLTPVSALAGGRIWTFKFPQSPTLPAICFQQISDVQFGHLRGTAALKWARVQCDCIGTTIKAARDLDQAVMGTYVAGVATGLLGSTANVGTPSIQMIIGPESLLYREDFDADELKQARVSRDYKVWIESV